MNISGTTTQNTIITNEGFPAKMHPENTDDLNSLKCKIHHCGNLFQTPLMCNKYLPVKTGRHRRCETIICAQCYLAERNCSGCNRTFTQNAQTDLKLPSNEYLTHVWANVKTKCPEQQDCQSEKPIVLDIFDQHMKTSHGKTNTSGISSNSGRKRSAASCAHSQQMDLINKLRTYENEALPSTSGLPGNREQAVPEGVRSPIESFFSITKTLEKEVIIELYKIYCMEHDLPSDHNMDALDLAEKLTDKIKNDSDIDLFFDTLNALVQNFPYTDLDKFHSNFPAVSSKSFARPADSQCASHLTLSTLSKEFWQNRQARTRLIKLIGMCNRSQLDFLNQYFKLKVFINTQQNEIEQLRELRQGVLTGFNKKDLSLYKILQAFQSQNRSPLLIKTLQEEINIDNSCIHKDILSKFNKAIGSCCVGNKEMSMALKIELDKYKLTQLALIFLEPGYREKVRSFSDVFEKLERRGIRLKELIEALVDLQLFKGEVKDQLTICYGNPDEAAAIKRRMEKEKAVDCRVTLPQNIKGGYIMDRLTEMGKSATYTQHRSLINCLKKCSEKELKEIAFRFNFKRLENIEFGYPDLLKEMALNSITVERLFAVLESEESYSHLTKIFLCQELPARTEPLKGEIKVSSDPNWRGLWSRIGTNGILQARDIKMLALIFCDMRSLTQKIFQSGSVFDLFDLLSKKVISVNNILEVLHATGNREAYQAIYNHYKSK